MDFRLLNRLNAHFFLLPLRSLFYRRLSTRANVCIVGGGPSAFYAAQHLLKYHKTIHIDMMEKLPVPFGLVRYGVAPDHPEIKNVINVFTKVAKNEQFSYVGNVDVGKDIKLGELRRSYDAVLLAYGATLDKKMNIPGEELNGVISAKEFVGWYNGYPESDLLPPNLDCETVAVVGMGNVALDVARILLSSAHRLKYTDIPEAVLSTLASSRVQRVILFGRRGPLHAAFTLKEFRELTQLPAYKNMPDSNEKIPIEISPEGVFESTIGQIANLEEIMKDFPRPRRRLTQFLSQFTTIRSPSLSGYDHKLALEMRFLRSPRQVFPKNGLSGSFPSTSSCVGGLELCSNLLQGPLGIHQSAIVDSSADLERIDCGLVIYSIGSRSVCIDPDIPFDASRGVVFCIDECGRVDISTLSSESSNCEAPLGLLYACGWAKRGSTGVIVDTSADARMTAEAILVDLAKLSIQCPHVAASHPGFGPIKDLLRQRKIRTITFSDWERIDDVEKDAGKLLGKPREKFTSTVDMLNVAFQEIKTRHS